MTDLRYLAWVTILAVACAGDSQGDDTATAVSDETSGASSATTTESGTGALETSGGPNETTGGGEQDLGPCADYIECAMDATPDALTTAIAIYGTEGSCWDLPGGTEQDCWTECAALLDDTRMAYPDAEACWECSDEKNCRDTSSQICQTGNHTCAAKFNCPESEAPGTCTEVPETYPICGNSNPGPCPAADILGTCSHFPDDEYGVIVVFYSTGRSPLGGPWTPRGAQTFCESTLSGQWAPAP